MSTVDRTRMGDFVSYVALEAKRVDDLRDALERRIDDLRIAESHRIDQIAELDRVYTEKLRLAEERRINANAIAETTRLNALLEAQASASVASLTRGEQTAATLRESVDTKQSTLAGQVETSAAALRSTNASDNFALTTRITALERQQYEYAALKVDANDRKTQTNFTLTQVIAFGSLVAGTVFAILKS